MEKLPRQELLALLTQWRQVIADAMLVRAGLSGGSESTAIGRSRTGTDLSFAMGVLQKAMDACTVNVGGGHICGWLATLLP